MPELINIEEITKMKEEMKTRSRFGFFLPSEEVDQLIENYDKDLVGKGAECVVFSERDESQQGKYFGLGKKPFREDVVVAVDYRTVLNPIQAKEIFYTQRIMATLFPFNFPRFRTSFGSEDEAGGVSATIRNKIDIVDSDEHNASHIDLGAKHPFSYVAKTINELRLPVNIDKSDFNFGRDGRGDVYFLDKVRLKKVGGSWSEEDTVWDKDTIDIFMSKNNYSESDKRIVRKSIDRLTALQGENVSK